MNSIYLERDELKNKIFRLMHEVSKSLKNEPNVDDFLDKTNLFDYWESVLPDEEYPIFVMAVLNNIKRDSIIDTILNSIERNQNLSNTDQDSDLKQNEFRSHIGEHPFN